MIGSSSSGVSWVMVSFRQRRRRQGVPTERSLTLVVMAVIVEIGLPFRIDDDGVSASLDLIGLVFVGLFSV